MRGIFLQTFQADRFQIAIHTRSSPRKEALIFLAGRRIAAGRLSLLTSAATNQSRRHRLLFHHFAHRRQRRVGLERGTADDEFVKNCAEAVNVRRRGDFPGAPGGLLGRHVVWRADDRAAQGQVESGLNPLGETKVSHERLASRVEQNVGRLQIAGQHAALVCVVDGAGSLDQKTEVRSQRSDF